jgi:nucleotide-binding universal stress UspA family protein
MDPAHVPSGTIVVGVDGSPDAERALDWASDQAAGERRTLTLVHALQLTGFPAAGALLANGVDAEGLREVLLEAGRGLLADARARALERRPGLEVAEVLSTGDARNELLALSRRAALVVVGSRGRGPVTSLLLGSVSVTVSKHASCPVVVCRPLPTSGGEPGHGVLVGVDGTAQSLPAIELAFRMAALRGERLTVLHCYWDIAPPDADGTPEADLGDLRALVAESISGMAETFPEVVVDVRLRRGFADRALVDASGEHALVVVGHHPLSALEDLVHGSLTPALVERARCAVAVVPALAISSSRHPAPDRAVR